MYKIALTIVKYDRDLLDQVIRDRSENTIKNILSDFDIRPETKTYYCENQTVDNLTTAAHIYNNYLDDMNFDKDPANETTKHIYIQFLKLYEIRFDDEALIYYDLLAECNELLGGTRFDPIERIGK